MADKILTLTDLFGNKLYVRATSLSVVNNINGTGCTVNVSGIEYQVQENPGDILTMLKSAGIGIAITI